MLVHQFQGCTLARKGLRPGIWEEHAQRPYPVVLGNEFFGIFNHPEEVVDFKRLKICRALSPLRYSVPEKFKISEDQYSPRSWVTISLKRSWIPRNPKSSKHYNYKEYYLCSILFKMSIDLSIEMRPHWYIWQVFIILQFLKKFNYKLTRHRIKNYITNQLWRIIDVSFVHIKIKLLNEQSR
jgi:hypothetical protein